MSEQSMTLFKTNDPSVVLDQATNVANALKDVIVKKKMFTKIHDKNYVNVEGWQTLGSMMGVSAVITKTGPTADGKGFKARAEAVRISNGQVIGAAEAVCTRGEKTWATRDDYALLGMAQTRAISRALRGPLAFIMKIAGYEGTGEEEMPGGGKIVSDGGVKK